MNRRILFPSSLASALAAAVLAAGCGDKQSAADPEPTNLTGAEAAYQHTRRILDFGPRPPASAALQKTRGYLTEQLARSGWQVSLRPFERPVRTLNPLTRKMEENRVTFTNLVARFGSADAPDLWDRPVTGLLGAHIDSKYFPRRKFVGADDAASAAGVILELARDLGSSPGLASQLELVFFDGEEAFGRDINATDGLYGSRAYATQWRTAPRRPRFGIVLDMIGHKNLTIRYPSDTPPHLEQALLEAARSEGVAEHYGRRDGLVLDDHVPLNDAGIPTIDIIGDFTKFGWWHTESDNLRIISKQSLDITLRVTRRMLGTLLAEDGGGTGSGSPPDTP